MNVPRLLALIFLTLVLVFAPGCKRQYYSRVRVQYGSGAVFGRAVPDAEAEKVLLDLLPKGDASVKLQAIRNTSLFDIGVFSTDPKAAADRANELAVAMGKTLNTDPDRQVFKIWEKAEPSPLSR